MILKNNYLLFLCFSEFCKQNGRKITYTALLLAIVLILLGIYRYYHRLELIDRYEYDGYIFEEYIDWSKSTCYRMKFKDRAFEDNFYIIKKNGSVYFKYKHNFYFEPIYQAFTFYTIEQDSLVLIQKAGGYEYGVVFLKMPMKKDEITKEDVRIIPIYPGILKDGRIREHTDTTYYFLDDYKKVPSEVIDYEYVISNY